MPFVAACEAGRNCNPARADPREGPPTCCFPLAANPALLVHDDVECDPCRECDDSVCPGYTLTERVRSLAKTVAEKEQTTPEAIIKRWESAIPMGRLGTPEEFASLVAYLASESSSYITGAAIQIDGGMYKGVMQAWS